MKMSKRNKSIARIIITTDLFRTWVLGWCTFARNDLKIARKRYFVNLSFVSGIWSEFSIFELNTEFHLLKFSSTACQRFCFNNVLMNKFTVVTCGSFTSSFRFRCFAFFFHISSSSLFISSSSKNNKDEKNSV